MAYGLTDPTSPSFGNQPGTNSVNGQTVVLQLQRQLSEMRMRQKQGIQPSERLQSPSVSMLLGPSNIPPFQF